MPNEALRDFCRTLKNVGCGYYPNSVFVHMDVRDAERVLDRLLEARRGAALQRADLDADEGTSDVHDDGHAAGATGTDATTATPSSTAPSTDTPSVPTMPATPGLTAPAETAGRRPPPRPRPTQPETAP